MIELEAEVPMFLLVGFSIVALSALLVLIVLFARSRNRNILFFVGHLAFVSLTFWNLYQTLFLHKTVNPVMLSEECSLLMGLAGVYWAVSMVFLLIGIYRLLKKSKVLYQI